MYALDFRKKVLEVRERERLSIRQVARKFSIGFNTVMRWTKNITPTKTRQRSALRIDMEALMRDIEQYPDAYQYERAERLKVSRSTIGFSLKKLNVTYKKKSEASQSGSRKAFYVLRKT